MNNVNLKSIYCLMEKCRRLKWCIYTVLPEKLEIHLSMVLYSWKLKQALLSCLVTNCFLFQFSRPYTKELQRTPPQFYKSYSSQYLNCLIYICICVNRWWLLRFLNSTLTKSIFCYISDLVLHATNPEKKIPVSFS